MYFERRIYAHRFSGCGPVVLRSATKLYELFQFMGVWMVRFDVRWDGKNDE